MPSKLITTTGLIVALITLNMLAILYLFDFVPSIFTTHDDDRARVTLEKELDALRAVYTSPFNVQSATTYGNADAFVDDLQHPSMVLMHCTYNDIRWHVDCDRADAL